MGADYKDERVHECVSVRDHLRNAPPDLTNLV